MFKASVRTDWVSEALFQIGGKKQKGKPKVQPGKGGESTIIQRQRVTLWGAH